MLEIRITGVKETIKELGEIVDGIEETNNTGMWNASQSAGKGMREAIGEARLQQFSGELILGTYPQKKNKGEYVIQLPFYAMMISEMEPHIVKVRGRPGLELWTEMRFGRIPGYLYVQPHPFFYQGLENATRNFYRVYEDEFSKNVFHNVRKEGLYR